MATKTETISIKVSPEEKAKIRELAAAQDTTVSKFNILSAALQRFEHGLTQNDAISIFDAWLDEGHNIAEFIPVILDVYKVSGLISSENEDAAKN